MNRHRKTSSAIAAAAFVATLALTAPSIAASMPTAVTIQDGGDGIVGPGEAAALTVTASYVNTGETHMWVSVVANNSCTWIAPKVDTGHVPIAPGGGLISATLDVSGLPEGPLCAMVWTWDGAYSAQGVSAISILKLTSSPPTITYPANGNLVGVDVKNDGSRFFTARGLGTPGSPIKVFEINEGLLGTTTVNGTGSWALDIVLPTDTYTIWATQTEAGFGESAPSASVVFDLDADLPTASVTWPPNGTIFAPGEAVIIEGVGNDTTGFHFGGLLAVEANVHDPLIVEQRLVDLNRPGTPPPAGNVLGLLNVGEVIDQKNVTCLAATPCPTTKSNVVKWEFDASYLPPGTYTIQFLAHDRAGNEAIQPAVLSIVILG